MNSFFVLFSLNHKSIGLIYLFLGTWLGYIGLGLSMIIRLNLKSPYYNILSTKLYNFSITSHGIVMIFFCLMLVLISGFGNIFLPVFTRQGDMKLLRVNSFGLWILVPSIVCLLMSMYLGAGVSWTFYPPLSTGYLSGNGTDHMLIFMHLAGLSIMFEALNFIITCNHYFYLICNSSQTILYMDWFLRTPILVWAYYFTSFLLFLSIPVLAGAITMLLFDRNFGTAYFSPMGEETQ